MLADFSKLSTSQAYSLMSQTLTPRPIAWVLSDNGDGGYNLAPFSYFNAVCSDPPLVMISIGLQPDGSKKDTLVNIEERDHFVIHIASTEQLPALNQTAMTLPHGFSEIEYTDIELVNSENFSLPVIEGCPIAYLCHCYEIQEIGNNHQALVFGQIDMAFLRDDVVTQDEKGRLTILAKKVDALARLGASEYATLGETITLRRPA